MVGRQPHSVRFPDDVQEQTLLTDVKSGGGRGGTPGPVETGGEIGITFRPSSRGPAAGVPPKPDVLGWLRGMVDLLRDNPTSLHGRLIPLCALTPKQRPPEFRDPGERE